MMVTFWAVRVATKQSRGKVRTMLMIVPPLEIDCLGIPARLGALPVSGVLPPLNFSQPPFQEPALAIVGDQLESALIALRRFSKTSRTAQ